MSTAVQTSLFTPEDLLRMPDGDRYELVNGRLVERKMSMWSSYVAGRAFRLVSNYSESRNSGWVLPEGTSYQCFPDTPNKVRKPDTSFIRLDRISLARATVEGHVPIAPDLAVEVVSPHDTAYEIVEKVQEFLRAGTPLVWVVNPHDRTVQVYRQTGAGVILRENDALDGDEVLQGFHCRVADFFLPPAGAVANGATTSVP